MLKVKTGMTVPEGYNYSGAVITKVSKNGWCRGYYPRNVVNGNIEEATFTARAHWIVGLDNEYELIPD